MELTQSQAYERLVGGRKKAKGKAALVHKGTIGITKEALFLFGNDQGVVATPADDTLVPIIATWDGGVDQLPSSVEEWLQEYASEIEWWQNVGESLAGDMTTQAAFDNRLSIAAMLETKWSQSKPYNDLCIFDGKRCYTGCNATATAQLLYYWGKKGFHRGCKKTEAYKTTTNGYDVAAEEPIIVFDYNNIVKKPSTDKQKLAVATMMKYIGRSYHSDYTPNGTGAKPKDVAAILRDNFRMGDNISLIYASKGSAKFENAIYNEMLAGRPAIIAGWTGNGGGHTFIVDGYDVSNDLYHVNWGWGGQCDGHFALSALNPTASRAYNSNKLAIIGIQPDYKLGDVNGDGEINVTDAMQVMQDAQSGKYSEPADVNNDGQVTVTDAQLIMDKILGVGNL